ncbi:TonB-dependent siderophore receptor [Pseudoxanthomonas mexicana]|uniref:TonB-dependent siderophore receptor n=1 Tax=Pseudoxanthomonas mexicana TaxID=128785 RepID=UPI00398A76BD
MRQEFHGRTHAARSTTRPVPFAGNRLRLAIGLVLACTAGAAMAVPQEAAGQAETARRTDSVTDLDHVLVVAQRANRVSNGATNLDLDIKETPQSISVVTQEQMQQFGASNLNDALRLATGIQVEEWETNRTNFTARGFDIKNTQIDGVGLPNNWGIVTGAMDSFGYDKLEVIRGANGLLTGVGNASGTINYVRKRPTNDAQGQLGVSFGSWSNRRIEADYSTPFNENRTWAGRFVAAREDGDSWLRDYQNERTFLYGVVDGQIGDNGTLTFGYSWQQNDSDHNMWGALTFNNNDGTQAEWNRSASTTQDWTFWNTNTQTAFVEYTHQLRGDWRLKASYNHRTNRSDDQLFFAYTVTGLDPVTGEGLLGWAYKGYEDMTSDLGEVSLNGRFELLGREHEAMFGVSMATSEQGYWLHPTDFSGPAFGTLPGFPYAGNAVPEPAWGARELSTLTHQKLRRAFGATRLAFTDRLKAVLGVNWAGFDRHGTNIGEPFEQNNTSPYAGLTFDFNDDILGYVSYSDIYQPQDQNGIDGLYLEPTKGVNYEVGVKAEWLDRRLLTTLAWFSAKQKGLASYVGYDFDTARYYYEPVDVESRGFEFEAAGKLTDNVDLVFGYTHLSMDGPDGNDTFPWVPRSTANLALSARAPGLPALSYGIGGRWQSGTFTEESYTSMIVRQDSYAVVNAFVAWDFASNATLRANIGNLTDEKYINSLYQIGYYGAPRNYTLSLNWRF